MNRIFRVVWSNAKGCYVVVSELVNNRRLKSAVIIPLAILNICGYTYGDFTVLPKVYANITEGTVKDGGDMAIGDGSSVAKGTAPNANYSVAIGDNSKVEGNFSLAVGSESEAIGISAVAVGVKASAGENSVAIGNGTKSENNSVAVGIGSRALVMDSVAIGLNSNTGDKGVASVALGRNSQALGDQSITLGSGSRVEENLTQSIAIGVGAKANGNGSFGIALGEYSTVSGKFAVAMGTENTASGESAIAIGAFSNVLGKDSVAVGSNNIVEQGNTFILGSNVNSSYENSVILGANSEDREAIKVESAEIKLSSGDVLTYGSFAGSDPTGVVSVGSKGAERQIINVAAGDISEESTDAINGSQLYGLANVVGTNAEKINGIEDQILKIGEEAGAHTTLRAGSSKNINVTEGTNKQGGLEYTLDLSSNLQGVTSIDNGATGGNNTKINLGNNEINVNSAKITNIGDGEVAPGSRDAVNGGQLYEATKDIARMDGAIDKLGDRMSKVGAGAAALAALHPLDFDPDEKLSFSAGVGNYRGETAAALGAFYRPDEKVMFSIGGTFGNGENMVNAGITFALDRTSNVNNSKVAMAKDIVELRTQVAQLTALVNHMALGNGMESEIHKIFPDVPENHWAYEYVDGLAAQGIIEGYPDGSFDGNRLMTRYEFAAMLYRFMEKGVQLDSRIIKEFEAELGRVRVDRISGEDNDENKVERVRVNLAEDKDNYGSKILLSEE